MGPSSVMGNFRIDTTSNERINISSAGMIFRQPLDVPGYFLIEQTIRTPLMQSSQQARWAVRQFTTNSTLLSKKFAHAEDIMDDLE